MRGEAIHCIPQNEKTPEARLGFFQSRGAHMGLNPLDNDNPLSDNSQTRPKFDWPKLRQAIEFFEKQGVCYLPAGWGRFLEIRAFQVHYSAGPRNEQSQQQPFCTDVPSPLNTSTSSLLLIMGAP